MLTMSLLLALASYLAGSIPFGLMIGRAVKGIDLRQHGSGNIGATNAGRVLGQKWGLVCLVLDALKGLLPVAFLPALICGTAEPAMMEHLRVLAGVSTIVGHMFSCWLGFRGGKGVATSLGVVAMLSPWGLLAGFVAFVVTVLTWRIISVSSMLAAVTFGVYELATLNPSPFAVEKWSHGLFAIAVPLLILFQHRSNVRRLLKGEEPRFGRTQSAKETGEIQTEG